MGGGETPAGPAAGLSGSKGVVQLQQLQYAGGAAVASGSLQVVQYRCTAVPPPPPFMPHYL